LYQGFSQASFPTSFLDVVVSVNFIQKEKIMKKKTEITVSNIWLASFLLYSGEKFIGSVPDGVRISFIFQDSPDIQEKISDFLTDRGTVHPQKYISFYQFLKNLIYQVKSQ
jgi:hypothetical protein